jgi:hypothetical protein
MVTIYLYIFLIKTLNFTKIEEIHAVEIVGGSSRIPAFKNAVAKVLSYIITAIIIILIYVTILTVIIYNSYIHTVFIILQFLLFFTFRYHFYYFL